MLIQLIKKKALNPCVLLASMMMSNLLLAEAVFDGTIGPNVAGATRSGNFTISQSDGQVRGSNLFHSFRTFNVNAGERATFTSSGVNNIVSRVTGSTSTTINGALISDASFWFFNPNGIAVTANAQLDVSGSLYLGATDAVQFGRRSFTTASSVADTALLTFNPTEFGFLSTANTVSMNGVSLGDISANEAKLFGNDVQIANGDYDQEYDLRISVDSIRNISLTNTTTNYLYLTSGNDIYASGLTVGGGFGGGAFDAGRNLTMFNSSGQVETITAAGDIYLNNFSSTGYRIHPVIEAGNDIHLIDYDGGQLGSLDIEAGNNLDVEGSTIIRTDGYGVLNFFGGSVSITGEFDARPQEGAMELYFRSTTGDFYMDGDFGSNGEYLISFDAQTAGFGGGASIVEFNSAGNLSLVDVEIINENDAGHAITQGEIPIVALGKVTLANSRIAASTAPGGRKGYAANVNITGNGIEITDSIIESETTGAAWDDLDTPFDDPDPDFDPKISSNIVLSAGTGDLLVSNTSISTITSETTWGTPPLPSFNNSGDITLVSAGNIELNAASFVSSTDTIGSAGEISISAGGAVVIDSASSLITNTDGSGNAGLIGINGNGISLLGGTQISSSSTAPGDAGSITLSGGAGTVLVENSQISSISNSISDSGAAGSILITGENIHVRADELGGSSSLLVNTNTDKVGGAGSIVLSAQNELLWKDSSIAATVSGSAGGALIDIDAAIVSITGANINASTYSSGNAAQISMDGAFISVDDTNINNNTYAQGDSGNIVLTGVGLVDINQSQLNTLSVGYGSGSISDFGTAGNVVVESTTGDVELVQTALTSGSISKGGGEGGVRVAALNGDIVMTGSVATATSLKTNRDIDDSIPTFVPMSGPGSIELEAANILLVNSGATVATDNANVDANVGEIIITTTGDFGMSLDSSKPIISDIDTEPGSFLIASGDNSAQAGAVSVSTGGNINIANTVVSSSTTGTGAAGSVTLSAGGDITMMSGDVISTTDGSGDAGVVILSAAGDINLNELEVSSAADDGSSGHAGLVSISGSAVTIGNNSEITSSSAGSGNANNVDIIAVDLTVTNSEISAAAEAANSGSAGNVSIVVFNNMTVNQNGQISTSTVSNNNAGEVKLAVANTLQLAGGSTITSSTSAAGNAGNIRIDAGSLISTSGFVINSESKQVSATAGSAGTINLVANDMDLVDGLISTGTASSNVSNAEASIILVTSGQLSLTDTGVEASSSGSVKAGTISLLSSSGQVSVEGLGENDNGIDSSNTGPGSAGTITLAGNSLVLTDARIATTVGKNAQADSASVADITLDSRSGAMQLTNSSISAETSGAVNAGEITLSGGDVILAASQIVATTSGSGNAGNITLGTASNKLDSLALSAGSGVETSTTGTGDAGAISIATLGDVTVASSHISSEAQAEDSMVPAVQQVSQTSDTNVFERQILNTASRQILANADDLGSAGKITVIAGGNIALTNNGTITTATDSNNNGTDSEAGNIILDAGNQLTLDGEGSAIDASTTGQADGGDIELTAQSVAITHEAFITSTSKTDQTGAAGNIVLKTPNLSLDNGTISTEALNAGGGNITLVNGVTLLAKHNSLIKASTTLNRAPSSEINGGTITLEVSDSLTLDNSKVEASAENRTGATSYPVRGGKININPGKKDSNLTVVMHNRSRLNANAIGADGGTVEINAGFFLLDASSRIDVSAVGGLDGTITNTAPQFEESAVIGELLIPLLDASDLLQQACDSSGERSTFVLRGGTTARAPGDYISGKLPAYFQQNQRKEQAGAVPLRWESEAQAYIAYQRNLWSGCRRAQVFQTSMLIQ